MAYLTHAIDNSPTLYGEANTTINNPAMLAVKFNNGKLVLPSAGDAVIGIVLADQETVAAGEALHVQIKDICYWMAGGTIAAGDQLKTDAAGKCVAASAGDVVNAIALEAGSAGKPCKVLICHSAVPASA
jgi:hypothetical protein